MIYLLHGSDNVSSRSHLLKLRESYETWETVDAKAFLKNPEIFLSAQGLFSEKRLVIVENLTPKENEPLTTNEGIDLVIWVDDLISRPPKWVEKALVFKETSSSNTFKWADALTLGQERESFLLLEKLLQENTPSEILIGSLVRQLRLLALGLAGEWQKVSASDFVVEKVRSQIKFWNRKKIRSASLLVLKTDWDLKNGFIKPNDALTFLVSKVVKLAGS